MENPTELDTWALNGGNGYSDSQALYDPHAFMFSPEKGILVIPVDGYSYEYYGSRSVSSAYVFAISPEDGITELGSISHKTADSQEYDYYGYYYGYNQVKRSFIIGDTLYTVSDELMKANAMDGLGLLATVELN